MTDLDDYLVTKDDLAHLARLAIAGQQDDVRLFVAKLVRKYRTENPEFADRLDQFLKDRRHVRSSSPLRRTTTEPVAQKPLPADQETHLSLLKLYEDNSDGLSPLLSNKLRTAFDQLIRERQQTDRLTKLGLYPTRSAIFLGPPGVGKTMTARWLASQLNVPLLVLDLTTVMSSLLGKTGANIRAALEYAKQTPSVLLLDEIDAIAKRRNDDSDVGELKRLVTVMLQEVDAWPASGLLLAATNHPELIDPALWRRFDMVIEFHLPEPTQIKEAVLRFAGSDILFIDRWLDILTCAFHGTSVSDIERTLHRMRRTIALGGARIDQLVEDLVRSRMPPLSKEERLTFALLLEQKAKFSQRKISELTGLARDTIRKQRSLSEEKTSWKEAR
jgi:SpoVK/Ycf46/Vps4 family AAA+-type ATPase